MNGRKIKREYENPVDNILYDISEIMNKQLYKIPFMSPNIITTISLIISLIAIYLIYNNNYKIGSIILFIGYFFDCADGNYARKYKMETKFGDYYDHISDISKLIILIFIIVKKNNINFRCKIVSLILISLLFLIMSIHFGCQEKNTNNKQKSKSLSFLTKLCSDKKYIKYTRYFGCGTFLLITSILLFNFKAFNQLFSN